MNRSQAKILAAGSAALLIASVLYAWSAFVPYVQKLNGWNAMQTSGIFTVALWVACLGQFLSDAVAKRLGARAVIRTGAVFLALAFAVPGVFSGSLAAAYVGFGVFSGLGVGIVYNGILTAGLSWFRDKPGTCSGTLLMFYGFGSTVVSYLAHFLLENLTLRTALLILAALEFAVLTAASAVVRENPAEAAAEKKSGETLPGVGVKRLLHMPIFYCQFFWMVVMCVSGLTAIGSATSVGLSLRMTPLAAVTMAGVLTCCNGLSRGVFGVLFDRLGSRKSMLMITLLQAAGVAVSALSLASGSAWLLTAGFLMIGLGYGGCNSLNAALTEELYGPAHFSQNLAVINLQCCFSSLLGPALGGAIYTASKSYLPVFFYLLAASAAAGLLMLCYFRLKRKVKT